MSLIKRTRDSRSRQERERDREMMEVGRLGMPSLSARTTRFAIFVTSATTSTLLY